MFGKRTKNPKNYHKNLKMELEHGRLEKEKQTSTKHQFFEVVCFPGITLCTTPFLSYYASCWLVSQTLGLFTLKLGKFSLRIEKRTFRKFRETPATTMNISTTTPKWNLGNGYDAQTKISPSKRPFSGSALNVGGVFTSNNFCIESFLIFCWLTGSLWVTFCHDGKETPGSVRSFIAGMVRSNSLGKKASHKSGASERPPSSLDIIWILFYICTAWQMIASAYKTDFWEDRLHEIKVVYYL